MPNLSGPQLRVLRLMAEGWDLHLTRDGWRLFGDRAVPQLVVNSRTTEVLERVGLIEAENDHQFGRWRLTAAGPKEAENAR